MYLSRMCFCFILLAYGSGLKAQAATSLDSAMQPSVQSQLDSLKAQLNDLKYQMSLLINLLQVRTTERNYVKWEANSNLAFPVPTQNDIHQDSTLVIVDRVSTKRLQNQPNYHSTSSAQNIVREIRRQEANDKLVEEATKTILDLIFKPKR
ncbi:MAG: hypothetical protein JNL75_05270 [Chitinophagales bacterium]|nr:hypothetical protein [Chitinophagales bacterium]